MSPPFDQASEPFARLPIRLLHLFERGDMTSDELALLAFLHLRCFPRDEVAMTSAGLLEALGWDRSRAEGLRRMLVKLRDLGLIEYKSTPGQRRPFVFKLTGAWVDLHTTSTRTPPTGEEVTSTSRRLEEPAIPLTEPDQPPHDLHAVEVLRKEVDKTYVVDDYDEEFELAIAPVGRLTSDQRRKAYAAWRETPSGVRALVSEAQRGHRPAALFDKLIRDGAHRDGGNANGADMTPERLCKQLATMIRNGYHLATWETCEDVIADEEKCAGVTLTTEQRLTLFEAWERLQPDDPEGGTA